VSGQSRTPKFQMPSVYRPKNEAVYRCKVGYYRNQQGPRKRREFRLSDDPVISHKMAIDLEEMWIKEESRHWHNLADCQEVFNEADDALPVWTGLPESHRAAVEDHFATPWENLREDDVGLIEVAQSRKTLASCANGGDTNFAAAAGS
jgi:hypothetical protein